MPIRSSYQLLNVKIVSSDKSKSSIERLDGMQVMYRLDRNIIVLRRIDEAHITVQARSSFELVTVGFLYDNDPTA